MAVKTVVRYMECAAQLGRSRRRVSLRADVFLVVAGLLFTINLVLIAGSCLWHGAFGIIMLGYGIVLSMIGLIGLRLVIRGHAGDVDWRLARWPGLFFAAGLTCALAYVAFAG